MTSFPTGAYEQILELALKGFTAAHIADKLNLDIIAVAEVMPAADERRDIRNSDTSMRI